MAIKPLPRKIRYTERDGTTKVTGIVEKEVWIRDNHEFGSFRKLIQQVRFDHRKRKYVRLGYYVKDRGVADSKYLWGSQFTFILSKTKFRELLKEAKRQGII